MLVTLDTDTIREVARRTANPDVRDAFRMLAALLDRHHLERKRADLYAQIINDNARRDSDDA